MTALCWAISSLFLACGAWIIALNWSTVWIGLVGRQRAPSWIPLLGGVFGAIGLAILPLPGAHRLCWVPLLVDWGSIPGIGLTILFHLVRIVRRRD